MARLGIPLAWSVALAVLVSAGASARAGGPPELPDPTTEPPIAIDLEWTAPDNCPATDAVRAAIAALLARRVELDPTASVVARGDITRSESGYRLRLSVDTSEGTEARELDADRCDVLGEAAALIVATGIDPARVAARVHEQTTAASPTAPPPSISTQPSETTPPPAATEAKTNADRPHRAKAKPRGAITITTGPAIGLVPSVAAWLGGDVMLNLGRARIGATVGHAFARPTSRDDGIGARVQLTNGGLFGCFVPSWRKVSLAACGIVEVGAMQAGGIGNGVASSPQTSPWVGLGLRSGVEWAPIRWLALVAQVDVLAAARRPGFHVVRAGESVAVFRAAPAALRLTAGLSVRFP